jgi:radical SAM superfamily enzyme YgiQ (UPF0313 family)
MNTLLIYPEFPDTFWSFRYALKFIHKKASSPPLGLLTVAAMLPKSWPKRLVDLNVEPLTEEDLAWADCAMISAMNVQHTSAREIIDRCQAAGLKIVVGGPLFTIQPEDFMDADHLVLNEAEITLPRFLADLERGEAKHVYTTDEYAEMHETPNPMWELAPLDQYDSMSLQFSRGCPFNCDFCNVTALLGHRPRTKSAKQITAELDSLYELGWRGSVFFVDDNFIGNRRYLKERLLPALMEWREGKVGMPFNTEVSIDLADDDELIELMVAAGFDKVFIGIETPNEESLTECRKNQNTQRDLVADVKHLQRMGLRVQGGFIVGFDHDLPNIFQRQIEFIQQSGIVTAMVGLLQAPPGTGLYERLKEEGRLLSKFTGDNVSGATNIIPEMGLERLHEGYKQLMQTIYSPRHYYERVKTFLREYQPPKIKAPLDWQHILAFPRSVYHLGILGKERRYYWDLLLWTLFRRPALFPMAVTFAIYGHHFQKVCELHIM